MLFFLESSHAQSIFAALYVSWYVHCLFLQFVVIYDIEFQVYLIYRELYLNQLNHTIS